MSDAVERIALVLYNQYLKRAGMRAVDYIGANQTHAANTCREDARAVLEALKDPEPRVYPWPSGCAKPNTCSRYRDCMYGCAAHKRRPIEDLRPEIDKVVSSLPRP